MPARLFVKVNNARGLPVMDRGSSRADPYVEIRLGSQSARTQTCKKTLHPVFNEELILEVLDDATLEVEPLQVKCYDRDVVSSDDLIGSVLLDLLPMLNGTVDKIQGWLPIYDSLRGACGDVNVVVRLEHIADHNQADVSSLGVQVIAASSPAHGIVVSQLVSYVEELVVDDDPEHSVVDHFRSSRQSNYERALILHRLSGLARRGMSRQAVEMGCNSVLQYRVGVDIEGGALVVRASGTAAIVTLPTVHDDTSTDASGEESPSVGHGHFPSSPVLGSLPQSSYIDDGQLRTRQPLPEPALMLRLHSRSAHALRLAEVQLLTTSAIPDGVDASIGGLVAARSVRVLTGRGDVQGTRDGWWSELREEIRGHAKAYGCLHVLGYTELVTISNGIALLSALGTAVKLKYITQAATLASSPSIAPFEVPEFHLGEDSGQKLQSLTQQSQEWSSGRKSARRKPKGRKQEDSGCSVCHIPFAVKEMPFSSGLIPCQMCHRHYVPELLISSTQLPADFPVIGCPSSFVLHVIRSRPELSGEAGAHNISELIPFMEYDIHKLLVAKLRIRGHNAVFGMRVTFSVGEAHVVALAQGSSMICPAIPLLPPLRLQGAGVEDGYGLRLSTTLSQLSSELSLKNSDCIDKFLEAAEISADTNVPIDEKQEDDDSSSTASTDTELNQNMYILQIEDSFSLDLLSTLEEIELPTGVQLSATEEACHQTHLAGVQTSTCVSVVKRLDISKLHQSTIHIQLLGCFKAALSPLLLAAKSRAPCFIAGMKVHATVPDDELLQWIITASIVPMHPCTFQDIQSGTSLHTNMFNNRFLNSSFILALQQQNQSNDEQANVTSWQQVPVTSLQQVPGHATSRHVCCVERMIIKEVWSSGNIEQFLMALLGEATMLVRAHAFASGANAVIHFDFQKLSIEHDPSRGHVYALIVARGDAIVAVPAQGTSAMQGHAYRSSSI